jgi:hypothetical protein
MEYRVILLSNGVFKKTLHVSKTPQTAFLNYHKLKEENNVLYPKKFINSLGIKPVKYQICVTKTTEEGDTFRLLRDDYGKLYTEKPIGDWTIIDSDSYQLEETFYIYGYEPNNTKRPNITEIVKRLMVNAHAKKAVKQIIVVYNKLIIYNEDQFDMVLCKNLVDAQRLHHTLAKIAKKQKIKSLMFMGTASAATISRIYDMIHEKTGWPYIKIRRTSTRP